MIVPIVIISLILISTSSRFAVVIVAVVTVIVAMFLQKSLALPGTWRLILFIIFKHN